VRRIVMTVLWSAGVIIAGLLAGCSDESTPAGNLVRYSLDANASGVLETINNIANLTVVSKDPNDLRAEYRAGFVQGKLQGPKIKSARDNTWDNAYLTSPSHTFPKEHGPTQAELEKAGGILWSNYNAFLLYLKNPATESDVSHRLKRLLFRLLGVYHGATLAQPDNLDFSGGWLPDSSYLQPAELVLGYETNSLTFMDLYFVNAFHDLFDHIAFSASIESGQPVTSTERLEKCSAFLKRSGNEIILTHNTWQGFLTQSMTMTLAVNGDISTFNPETAGMIGSSSDFGFNNKGIMFNETTHRLSRGKVKDGGLWIFWRSTLAEQFAGSIDQFFKYLSLDNSGTYLNGYMLADAKNNETGLMEMSYRCFVSYRSTGGPYVVTTVCSDDGPNSSEYDGGLVNSDYLMGINYPASTQVREDLQSTDNRPARRRQFTELLPGVNSVETAKAAITYTDPGNPLSIYGRWDLGYGETDYPKQVPAGSVDAKVATASMVRSFMGLSGIMDTSAANSGYWMRFGTPSVNGAPFIWSQSSWKWQQLRDVPDRLDGVFTLMPLHLR
jgi:hypothetical protein